MDDVEKRIDAFRGPKQQDLKTDFELRQTELAQVEKEIQGAFRLRADAGAGGLDDFLREQLEKLRTRKVEVEARLNEIRAELEAAESVTDQRKVIECNLIEFRQARGGANRRMLKRLTRKVIESIIVEPGRIGLRYWTSNERREDILSGKKKGALDRKVRGNPPGFSKPGESRLTASGLREF